MVESHKFPHPDEIQPPFRIDIIESGDSPLIEVPDGWALGLPSTHGDKPELKVSMIRLRTFNSDSLVNRCWKAWHQKRSIYLVSKDVEFNLTPKAFPILAARSIASESFLILWIGVPPESMKHFDVQAV